MKKYKASELVARGLHLADMANTDFLSHTEMTDYLNDAYTEVYNDIIKHGDEQFIKEVMLIPNSTSDIIEYVLPSDFYVLHSLVTEGGNIVPRSSTNGYQIVNDRLRINGVAATSCTLRYYSTPTWVTFPDRTIATGLSSELTIVSSAGNSILTSDGAVLDLVTGDTVATIAVEDGHRYYLGSGCYCDVYDDDGNYVLEYKSLSGAVNYSTALSSVTMTYDNHYQPHYIVDNDVYYYSKKVAEMKNGTNCIVIDGSLFEWNNESFWWNDREYSMSVERAFPAEDFEGHPSLTVLSESTWYRVVLDDIVAIEELNIPGWKLTAVRYGVVSTDGTTLYLYSATPDTLMNFPNEVFYQLISANIGMRFLMKQNADASGLAQTYENMLNTFYSSLGQDGAYTVVKEVV